MYNSLRAQRGIVSAASSVPRCYQPWQLHGEMHIPAICSAVLVSVPSASGGVAASGVQTEGRVLILFTALSDMRCLQTSVITCVVSDLSGKSLICEMEQLSEVSDWGSICCQSPKVGKVVLEELGQWWDRWSWNKTVQISSFPVSFVLLQLSKLVLSLCHMCWGFLLLLYLVCIMGQGIEEESCSTCDWLMSLDLVLYITIKTRTGSHCCCLYACAVLSLLACRCSCSALLMYSTMFLHTCMGVWKIKCGRRSWDLLEKCLHSYRCTELLLWGHCKEECYLGVSLLKT